MLSEGLDVGRQLALTKQTIHHPHYQAEHNAQEDAGRDGKEESRVLAAVMDVPWQPSERNPNPSGKQNAQADRDQQTAHCD